VLRERVATPQGDYRGTLQVIADLVRRSEENMGQQGSVGIATPGAISAQTGRIKNSNSTCLNHQPVREDLERLLQREVRLENDANCFALSEAIDGAGRDANAVFGVIVGTGTGGGIVVDKNPLVGPNAIAGEWGHNPLPWPRENELPGPDCYCGKQGCIETYLSGPGLSREFAASYGRKETAQTISGLARANDRQACMALDDYEDRMARALASVINILDPDVIVLGGGMSNIERLYRNVPQRWGEYVFSDSVATRLLPPVHGDSSGVRGAAWLWND
jgi:fructokinase